MLRQFTAPIEAARPAPSQINFARSASVPIPGRYIVVFKSSVSDVDAEAAVIGRRHGGTLRHVYKSALRGMTVNIPDAKVAALRAEPNVAYVEQDQTMSLSMWFDSPLVNAASGLCLTSAGAGSLAATTACSGATSQLFSLPAEGAAGQVLLFGTACLDAFGGGGNVGDTVGLWSCHGGMNQSWTLTSTSELRGINGLCVAASSTSVTLQTCNGSANQRWTASAVAPPTTPPSTPPARFDSPMVNGASEQCLMSTGVGAPATTAACNGATSQEFSLPAGGTAGQVLLYGASCLDAVGGGGNAGDVVGLWSCHEGTNQSWTLSSSGELRGINGLCVTTGTGVTLQLCTGSTSQRWTASALTPPSTPTPAPSTPFDSPLVNGASGQCLMSAGAGSLATTAACSGASGQLFSLPAVGTAGQVLLYGTSCLDAFDGGGSVGDSVGLWSCHGGTNQSWTRVPSGELRGINGLCVAASGTSVTLQACNGSTSQRWTASALTAPGTPSTTQLGAGWWLDRLDQRALPLSGSYTYQADGTGVNAYIIDTGINLTHTEFGGRATTGIDQVTPSGNAADCNGHGTHVAGIVGGLTSGVAKNVRLVAVRVLDCSGSGSTSSVIAGIDWVTANRVLPAVANLSLGGGFSQALNDAVQRSINVGVVFTVAAGNSAVDACTVSPASLLEALTVGATDDTDAFAGFSNYGSCVKINAPGVGITSAWIGSSTAMAGASGTSMASPQVAGAAAAYLQRNADATPAQVGAALTGSATTNVIRGTLSGTPNLLLYSSSGT